MQVVTNNVKCHSKTSEMKSTRSELQKTSKIIEKVQLSTKLSQFEKKHFFNPKSYILLEIHVDLRSDNDISTAGGPDRVLVLDTVSVFNKSVKTTIAVGIPRLGGVRGEGGEGHFKS